MTHQALINEITQELCGDENVLALLLYGSFARHEENANSDIDLMIITNEMFLQKWHEVRYGITIEFLEMHLSFLKKFIKENEVPMYFALTEGVILFDKNSGIESLITEAKKILAAGPPVNEKWKNEKYKIKKRFELTEIYSDLLDIDDEVVFNYVASLLIANAIPLLLENNNLWPQSRKRTLNHLKSQCYEGYKYIEILLNPSSSLPEKRCAMKKLTEYVLQPYGGILEGDVLIFKKEGIS